MSSLKIIVSPVKTTSITVEVVSNIKYLSDCAIFYCYHNNESERTYHNWDVTFCNLRWILLKIGARLDLSKNDDISGKGNDTDCFWNKLSLFLKKIVWVLFSLFTNFSRNSPKQTSVNLSLALTRTVLSVVEQFDQIITIRMCISPYSVTTLQLKLLE